MTDIQLGCPLLGPQVELRELTRIFGLTFQRSRDFPHEQPLLINFPLSWTSLQAQDDTLLEQHTQLLGTQGFPLADNAVANFKQKAGQIQLHQLMMSTDYTTDAGKIRQQPQTQLQISAAIPSLL